MWLEFDTFLLLLLFFSIFGFESLCSSYDGGWTAQHHKEMNVFSSLIDRMAA